MHPEEARRRALDLLAACRVATVATCGEDGPWAATVYYADDGFTLYVNTPDTTTMLRNLLANPRVALTVDRGEPSLFLQARGTAAVVADPDEFARARALLARKVPEAHAGAPGFTLVRIACEDVYVTAGREPRVQLRVAEPPRPADGPGAIPVRFHLGGQVFAAWLRPHQIIHEALEAALPPEVRVNHRLQFRTPDGREVFADHFARDLQEAGGAIELVVEATPVPPPAGTPRFRNYGFDHLAIVVADRAAARDFFAEGLGLRVVRDDAHQTVVTSGPTALFLFDARPGIPLSDPVPSRWHHIGFVVDDLAAALWRVRHYGRGVSSDFVLLERNERWSLYLHYANGPARLMVQLSQIKPGYRGLADAEAYAAQLYDYGRGPYGAPKRADG